MLASQKDAFAHDLIRKPELLQRCIFRSGQHDNARIIHQNIQITEFIDCFRDNRLPRRFVTYVMHHKSRLWSQTFGQRTALFSIDIGDHDTGTFCQQQLRISASQPGSTSGYDRHFALYASHSTASLPDLCPVAKQDT